MCRRQIEGLSSEKGVLPYIADSLWKWDSLHFEAVALFGRYAEKCYAFFDGLPWAISLVRLTTGANTLSTRLLFVLVQAVVFAMTSALLYKVSQRLATVFGRRNDAVPLVSFLLFCFQPSSVFLTAPYTEGLFAFFSLFGLLYLSKDRPLPSICCFFAASFLRSNGFLLAVMPPLFVHLRAGKLLAFPSIRTLLYSALSVTILFPFELHNVAASRVLCSDEAMARAAAVPLSGEGRWCNSSIPLVYGHVQAQYWRVGLFKYFEPKQIPNFGLALPSLLLVSSLLLRAKTPLREVVWYGRGKGNSEVAAARCLVLPLTLYCAALTVTIVVAAHVQILTRALSSVPLVYIEGAILLCSGRTLLSKFVVLYFVGFSLFGALMFCNFYPWT